MTALNARNASMSLMTLLAIASVTAAIVLSLRDSDQHATATTFQAADITVNQNASTELLGAPEPLFIDGEPETLPPDIPTLQLPDGSVSITNPNADIEWALGGWVDPATGEGPAPIAVGPVTVNASDLPTAPPTDPNIVFVAPNPLPTDPTTH